MNFLHQDFWKLLYYIHTYRHTHTHIQTDATKHITTLLHRWSWTRHKILQEL